jgi:hypothetical protein
MKRFGRVGVCPHCRKTLAFDEKGFGSIFKEADETRSFIESLGKTEKWIRELPLEDIRAWVVRC